MCQFRFSEEKYVYVEGNFMTSLREEEKVNVVLRGKDWNSLQVLSFIEDSTNVNLRPEVKELTETLSKIDIRTLSLLKSKRKESLVKSFEQDRINLILRMQQDLFSHNKKGGLDRLNLTKLVLKYKEWSNNNDTEELSVFKIQN